MHFLRQNPASILGGRAFTWLQNCMFYAPFPSLDLSTSRVGFEKYLSLISAEKELFKKLRKAFNTTINNRAAKDYRIYQLQAVHQFLENLLDTPEDFFEHTR